MLVRCSVCKTHQPPINFPPDKRKRNGLASECRSCNNKRVRKYYAGKRAAIFEKLGGPICVRCGQTIMATLQVDHIHGGGYRERKKLNNTRIHKLILTMTTDEARQKYQILCANCNLIKKSENGEHRQPSDSVMRGQGLIER